ncbi:MMPL family transporter [Nocardioides alkalitolerans]|uniref:MMPL family transporter n=1 Tax=Nocardioides alkalitolerans TaxID=281714 RepID=UPI00042A09EB|nr:MMPL family transporter [Nocardioides alkalitolerans]
MATLLYRLGKTAYRRWPLFMAGWFIALVAVGAVAATMSKPMTDNFSIPGIPSEQAADLQAELFPGAMDPFDQANATVVVGVPEDAPADATLADPEYAEAIDALVAELQEAPQIGDNAAAIVSPVAAVDALREQLAESGLDQAAIDEQVSRANIVSDDGRVGTIPFVFDVDTVADVEPASQDAVLDLLDDARGDLVAEVNGAGMQSFAPPGATSEAIGIGIALIILIITFGSFVAAGLPILTAILGVGLSITGITALTAFMDIGSSTPILSTMIGLAVGIDYTLFILARYRGELRHTDDRQEATGIAVGTAGSAVVFAGLTVLIALSALAVVGIPFLTAMGVAAGATVLISVLVALTLLPAVLGLLKSKAFGGQVRKYSPKHDTDGRGRPQVLNNGVRWARIVGKRPLAVVLLVTVALGALAIPLKDLHLAFPTDSTAAADTTQRKASDLLTEAFGPGQEATFLFVVDGRELAEGDRQAAYDEVVSWVEGQEGIEYAVLAPSGGGEGAEGGTEGGGDPAAAPVADGATIIGVPTTGPQDSATEDLLTNVRDGQSEIEEATGTTLGITGLTPITVDVSERLADALPVYLAVVVGLAFILLMIVFRSIIVPLTATLGFLLSVLATLGLTVLIFQEGTFGIMDPQPIVSFMPIFLIGVVFGLAMDYQVFLVTRIREAHVHGADPREAVIDGFRNSARVVAAAAAIMISVFAAFIAQDDAIIKSMGFALAVAVFLDAFIVRMTFIPALMYLLGDKAWYLPKWLDRILPDVDVEGEKLDRAHLRAGDDEPATAGV